MSGGAWRGAAALLAVACVGAAGTGCAGRKARASLDAGEVTAAAQYRRAMERLADRDLRKSRELLERIEYTPADRERLEPLTRLALADATFYQGHDIALIDARSLYQDFVTLYGDHPLAPYAQTQVGLCSLRQVNHASRDQTQTHRAVADLEEVIRRWPASRFAVAARGLLGQAREVLAESEYLVGRFYLKRKQYVAAVKRFRAVVERFPDYASREPVLFHMARALQLADQGGEARVYYDKLMQDYPAGAYAEQARKVLGSLEAGLDGGGVPD